MSPFYAYVIPNTVPHEVAFRYLIIFDNRNVSDEWWRLIVNAAANKVPGYDSIGRVSPQLYTHDPSKKEIFNTILDNNAAASLYGQLFFQKLPNRNVEISTTLIPDFGPITDRISGREFYIRAQRDPSLYWEVNQDRIITATRTDKPTPFLIRLRNNLKADSTVLIGSDDIVLSVPVLEGQANTPHLNIATNNESILALSRTADVFKVSDLGFAFELVELGSDDNKYFGVRKTDTGRGDIWELL